MASTKEKREYYRSKKGLAKIEKWADEGLTQEEIAKKIGIGLRTFNDWRERYPEVNAAYNGGLEGLEKQLVNALVKLGIGYKDTEVQVERYKLNGEVIENDPRFPIKEKIITKTFPPNVAALAFLLKCKFGWKEKSVVELEDNRESPMAGLTTEELRKLANACK